MEPGLSEALSSKITTSLYESTEVKTVNGQDVSTWDFADILDILGDKILDNSGGKFQSVSRGSRPCAIDAK